MSTVSKYGTCDSALTTDPINLCDDGLDGECISPPGSKNCRVHKHKLCDGVYHCSDHSDENNDICRLSTVGYFKCNRAFNVDRNMEIPVSWILDNQTDCLDGADERNISRCLINGSISTASKFVICDNPSKNNPSFMCDGYLDEECFRMILVKSPTNCI